MSVELPLEEQLMVERQVRAVHDSVDAKEIAEICGSAIRQNFYQKRLLQQAITRIMELEMIEECQDNKPEPLPWWRNILLRLKP